jgi:F-type H+-transporting ATPase subunit b
MTLLELFQAAEAWASAAGAKHHAPSIHQLWFPLINFLIFVYLIKRFAVPIIQDYLKSRRQGILTVVKEASDAKTQAEALVRDYRERLVRLGQEVKQIQTSLKDDGEREKNKLLSEASGLASKIKEDAQFLAEQEVKVARQKIREEMADRARASAAELVRRNLSSADQGRLVEEFVQSIGQVR